MKRPTLEDLYKDNMLDMSLEAESAAESALIEGELNMLDAMMDATKGARLMPSVDTIQ